MEKPLNSCDPGVPCAAGEKALSAAPPVRKRCQLQRLANGRADSAGLHASVRALVGGSAVGVAGAGSFAAVRFADVVSVALGRTIVVALAALVTAAADR